jgi:5'-3' exonuclease
MATHINKLYVFREAQSIDDKSTKKFLMVDIDLLKNGIYEDIQSKTDKQLELTHVINDYIMLGFFLGNDFLPNIPSLTLSPIHPKLENGLDILLAIYPEFINENDYIYKNDESLCNFLEILGKLEEDYFKKLYNRGRITFKTNETDPCKLALFQFDNLTLSDVNFLNLGKDNIEQYKKRYYKHFFETNNPETINKMCYDYFIGISWVKNYYFNTCPDWLWLYEHHQVPFASDLYNYMKNNKLPTINIVNNIYSIKPLEQLLMVNPVENANILPIECRNIFTNINLKKYFPKEYDFDIFMKTKFWMCYAIIPNPNYDDFMKEIKKIKFNEESLKLNKNFAPMII